MARGVWHIRDRLDGTVYQITKSPTVLGRSDKCDIVIASTSISSQHIQFNLDGSRLEIYDLNSLNGVQLDGKEIQHTQIKPSRRRSRCLEVGNVVFDLFFGPDALDHAESTAGSVRDLEQPEDDHPIWFFASYGVEHGPLTKKQLFDAVDTGTLHPTDDIWYEGLGYRAKAFEVEGLFEDVPLQAEDTISDFAGGALLCPYCWSRFNRDDVLFIATHDDLLGDPVLGSDEYARFLPERHTPEGLAIDASGNICPDMACPVCHMRLAAPVLEHQPLFVSVVGSPASGKSYYLASAIWKLRTTLPKYFQLRFSDVDAETNHWLNDYEEKLFFQSDTLAHQGIAKTDMTAPSVYREIILNNMSVTLPLPALFSLHADDKRPDGAQLPQARTLVLYDNAGEHFLSGQDSARNPVTRHLIHAESILFLFDPTADPRFHPFLAKKGFSHQARSRTSRQDVLLTEMTARIRKHLGLSGSQRIKKTLIIGISKADLLSGRLSGMLARHASPWKNEGGANRSALDLDVVREVSDMARDLLDRYAPEIVTTVESFAESVLYLPNSALGHNPSEKGVRPCDIKPQWTELPLLYFLSKLGYIDTTGTLAAAKEHP